MSAPVIQAEALTKIYRDFWRRPRARALDGVSFEVRAGEVFGLLGPNGSGKSTAIKLMLGLLHPTSGRLRVLGQPPRSVRGKARIGYLPEESRLYPTLTSRETVDFFGRLFDLPRAERRRRVEQLLEMVGLRHARGRLIGEFSKGMARRIGLAQALVNDPDLVLLDEPTSGLDPLGCRQIKDLIRALAARGKTILLSSHLLADVEDVCDRVMILYNGKIRAQGPLEDLLAEPGKCRYTLSDAAGRDAVVRAIRDATGETPVVDVPRRNLEKVFLDIIREAREEQTEEPSGAAADRGVAPYLREPGGADRVLEALRAGPAAAAELAEGAPEAGEPTPPPEKTPEEADAALARLLGRKDEPRDSP
jgi:ABC-2 type transport system ATP-binding protein